MASYWEEVAKEYQERTSVTEEALDRIVAGVDDPVRVASEALEESRNSSGGSRHWRFIEP